MLGKTGDCSNGTIYHTSDKALTGNKGQPQDDAMKVLTRALVVRIFNLFTYRAAAVCRRRGA